MKKYMITGVLALGLLKLKADEGVVNRLNDYRLRWNLTQYANGSRSTLQLGLEHDFANNKTWNLELGFIMPSSNYNTTDNRWNFSGFQGLAEYRVYLHGFQQSRAHIFAGTGLFLRSMKFRAAVDVAYNITELRDWNNATHYEFATTNYNTFTGRAHVFFGVRLPLGDHLYLEGLAGPAIGYYNIRNDLDRPIPFMTDNFYNPLFVRSQPGSYMSPAFYGSFSLGLMIAKGKKK